MSDQGHKAEVCAGALSGCLVDGDGETQARERKIKRRALGISVVLQTVGLAVLVIAPLLAKQPELVVRNAMPIPPYGRPRPAQTPATAPAHPIPDTHHVCVFCPDRPVRPIVPGTEPIGTTLTTPDTPPGGIGEPTGYSDTASNLSTQVQPPPPQQQTRRVHESKIDPAMLVNRVEPVYPPLARQLRRGGTVELHALIAADGTIQSLQVVSGDPLLAKSALDAVWQWRYKPTLLNGQAVEVDTYITVIYTVQ